MEDYDQLRMKARLDSYKLRKSQLENQKGTSKKVFIILLIITFPIMFYYYDKWSSVRKCNMFDNDLIKRYEAAKPKSITIEGYQIAMALRGNLRGIWRLVYFGAGDNSVKFPQMLQYYNRAKIEVSDGSALMSDIMADKQRAAVVIQTLYNTNMTAGSTLSVIDMVCGSGLDESYVPAVCYEEEEEPDCGKVAGVAALDGLAQSVGCLLSGNIFMSGACFVMTMGINMFGASQGAGCVDL